LEQYKNYENFPQSGELMDKVFNTTQFCLSKAVLSF
jgi:hypothetical protein